VRLFEGINARALEPRTLAGPSGEFEPVGVVTADLSFISLTRVVPVLAGWVVEEGGDLLLLVKPQFEAGRIEVSRSRGVVRDPGVWRSTIVAVSSALEASGTGIMGVVPSPLTGAAGNVEFFVHAVAGSSPATGAAVSAMVEGAVHEAQQRPLRG